MYNYSNNNNNTGEQVFDCFLFTIFIEFIAVVKLSVQLKKYFWPVECYVTTSANILHYNNFNKYTIPL